MTVLKRRTDSTECLVTVYMTAYNHEAYIARAIESVLEQNTSFQYCIIIHDDASTDRTAEIIRSYYNEHSDKITAILQSSNQYSKGRSAFIHYILPLISSKYIAICECDDFWTNPQKLETQVQILEKHPEYAAITHNCNYVDHNGNRISSEYGYMYGPFKTHIHTLDFYAKHPGLYPGQSATILYRYGVFGNTTKELMETYEGIRANGDAKRNLLILLQGNIYVMNEFMSSYRIVTGFGSSWTASTRRKNLSGALFLSYYDMKRFASKYYHKNLRNYYVLFHTGCAAAVKLMKNKTQENLQVYQSVISEVGGTIPFLMLMIGYGFMSIPTIVRKVLGLDKGLLLQNSTLESEE